MDYEREVMHQRIQQSALLEETNRSRDRLAEDLYRVNGELRVALEEGSTLRVLD